MMRPFVLGVLAMLVGVAPAAGYSEFQREFHKVYGRAKGADKAFFRTIRQAKCKVCHFEKDKETEEHPCNAYGLAMAEHVGEADKKDKQKIVAALRAVEAVSSDPADPESPTFGERLAANELPYPLAE